MFLNVGGQPRNRIARLNPDGSLDGFNPDANSAVWALALQPDGKLLVGGAFTQIAGAARQYLARLMPDGSVDNFFSAVLDNEVFGIAVQRDGKILITGAFTQVGGQPRNYIARLNDNGTSMRILIQC